MKKLIYSLFLWSCSYAFGQNSLTIHEYHPHPQVNFGMEEVRKNARLAGITLVSAKEVYPPASVAVIYDSTTVLSIVKMEKLTRPKSLGWQSYAIRRKGEQIWVLAGDATGAMYGLLDIAESILTGQLKTLSNSDNQPFLARRGIKFNIPLDLRTPSYSDPSDAFQQNIPEVWNMTFWKTYFDEMARYRYNVMTLWSLHPFPSIVKVPEFPDIALNDVWRTKEKLDNAFPHNGKGFVRPAMLQNHEVVKKMTIDEKITFWKDVMQYAHNRGIEIYWFTWNIFTYGAEGKYGINAHQTNDTTIRYFRASVRETVKTYPLLAGIGITAGENMENLKGENSNEKWLWKTYGAGIADALKETPKRDFRLIHRFHWTSLGEIKTEFKDYPSILQVSLKYAIAHMYSIPDPPFVRPAMPFLSKETQTWLTIRNDDIYSFRWANTTYARAFILSIPEPDKVAGYYMGADGYCLGRDFLSKSVSGTRPLLIEKQWVAHMLWGRLSYNPHLPDETFTRMVQARFPKVSEPVLTQAWSAASMVFPWITRFCWGDIDLKWLPEANISHPTFKGFYTVKDYIEVAPMSGSHIRDILSWAENPAGSATDSLLSPLAVADTLAQLSKTALTTLKRLPAYTLTSPTELDQTLGDIEAFAHIGNYYAAKIKGACNLALFEKSRKAAHQQAAIAHLTKAKEYWQQYARVYDAKYKPALYNRVGYVDIPALTNQVNQDIDLAKNWQPGKVELKVKQKTEQPFRK